MSIIATVIAGVIFLLKKILDNRISPNASYIICLVFICALVFPVSIPSRISVYNIVNVDNLKYSDDSFENNVFNFVEEINDIEDTTVNNVTKNNNIIRKDKIRFIVSMIWFTIFVILVIKNILMYIQICLKIGNKEFENEKINLILEESKKRLKIKRNIKVVKQNFVRVPSIIGIFNVKILITDDFLNLDDVSMLNIFMHELSHYKRKDNIMNVLILILKAVYWFNPIIYLMFKNIRENMEYATDEIAVGTMSVAEKQNYCMVMLVVATKFGANKSQVLGISDGAKNLKNRVELIALKNNFEKKSKRIFLIALLIIMFICLIFYPTSYGRFDVPKLYLKLEDGSKVEVIETENYEEVNEISVKSNSEINLCIEAGKPNMYIFYTKMNLETMITENEARVAYNKLSYFDSGEYIYKFILTYGNNESAEYAVKINVE